MAAPWDVAAVEPFDLGPAVAHTTSWDGAPAWFSGGPGGLELRGDDGAVLARSDALHPVALLVRQLDAGGDPEVVACGPEGLSLVRGTRSALSAPRTLSPEPCQDVAAYDLARYPALATVSGGELVTWAPTRQGLQPTRTGRRVVPGTLASAGGTLAAVAEGGGLVVIGGALDAPAETTEVAAGPGGFVWAAPDRWSGGPLEAPVTGLATDGDRTWLVDGPGRRLRTTDGPWVALPVAPARVVVVPTAGCVDLVLVDAAGRGARLRGSCEAPAGPPAGWASEGHLTEPVPTDALPADPLPADPLPAEPPAEPPAPVAALVLPAGTARAAPLEVVVSQDAWPVLDVRAGDTLSTRLAWGDGRAWRWSSRGGPPGFSVLSDGAVDFAATPDDVGRWRASVRSRWSPKTRWAGLEVRVWPAGTVFGDPADEAAAARVPATPTPDRAAQAGLTTWAAVGFAGGVATSAGSQWENLGHAPTGVSASPFGAAGLDVRLAGPVWWSASVDAAPFFVYPSSPDRRSHVIAGTSGVEGGSEAVHVGAYGTFGYTMRGVGLRGVVTPWRDAAGRRTGLELRATWLTPQIGFEAAVAWRWTL